MAEVRGGGGGGEIGYNSGSSHRVSCFDCAILLLKITMQSITTHYSQQPNHDTLSSSVRVSQLPSIAQ